LFGLLVLNAGRVVSTDRLVDELWGESPPPTVDTALQGLVSKLRARLEPDRKRGEPPRLLLTRQPGYLLAVEPTHIDAHRFRRLVVDAEDADPREALNLLRTALDLWRGQALADFTYEPFAQADIAALEELRLTALEKRVEADLALGRHREVIGDLETLVVEHPLRERLRELLMLALYRSGRQAEALEVYADVRLTMVDELGLDPGPSLQRLEELILGQDASLDLQETAVTSAAAAEWLTEERKTVTVLAADVAVSTGDGDEPDPETARRILDRVHREASGVVTGHGGTVEQMLGTTLVGLFGIPRAREDDAVRAVRAAVDLRHLISALNNQLGPAVVMRTRTGIDTGEVVVGETARTTTGGSVVSAGRLQRAADEDQILIGEATRLLIGKAALLEGVDGRAIADYGRPAWRVLDLAPASAVTPVESRLVDREHELEELIAGYRIAVEEQSPYRLTVLGEPGIGKSRLAREVVSRLTDEARVLTGRCPSSGEGVSFWPLREIVQAVAPGLEKDALLRLLGDEDDAEPIADHVLSAIGAAHTQANPSALFPMLRRFFESLARPRPLVLILEDVHWAQSTFLDLVEYLTERVRASVLFLCMARPELVDERPGWVGGSRATGLTLRPLGVENSRDLATIRLSGRMVPARVIDEVLERAQGNPFFVEQLVASIGEQGEVSLPPTVEALLAARIDRLGPAERDLARSASVLGHHFSKDAVIALLPESARRHALKHLRTLERKEFVDSLSSHEEISFRHALVQQAAYRSLTKKTRAELHEGAAAWMESRPEEMDETMGHHLELAYQYRRELGDSDAAALGLRAGEKLAAAGLRSFGRFDAGAAENLLSRARTLLPSGHPEAETVSFRLAEAYETMGRHDDADAILTDLLDKASDEETRVTLKLERAWVRLATGPDPTPLHEMSELAQDALGRFEREETRMLPLFILGEVARRTGRITEMEKTMRQALRYADRSSSTRYQLGARRMLATALDEGLTPVGQCIAECERLVVLRGSENGAVLPILGRLQAMNAQFDLAREMIAKAETLLLERNRARRPLGLVWKRSAEVEILASELEAAEDWLRKAVDLNLAMGIQEETSEAAALLSRVLFQTGRPDEAARMAELSQTQAPSLWPRVGRTPKQSGSARRPSNWCRP
jgi:DNA-binding SARP family transcriptional activator